MALYAQARQTEPAVVQRPLGPGTEEVFAIVRAGSFPPEHELEELADDPGRGYHFHTGRLHALRLGYDEKLVASIPAGAVESTAWSLQHPVVYTLLWTVAIIAVFAPLSIRRFRRQ